MSPPFPSWMLHWKYLPCNQIKSISLANSNSSKRNHRWAAKTVIHQTRQPLKNPDRLSPRHVETPPTQISIPNVSADNSQSLTSIASVISVSVPGHSAAPARSLSPGPLQFLVGPCRFNCVPSPTAPSFACDTLGVDWSRVFCPRFRAIFFQGSNT